MNAQRCVQASSYHTPVLVKETLSFLIQSTRGTYLDATLGGGGHAEAILRLLDPEARLIGLDADDDAIAFASRRLEQFRGMVTFRKSNFRDLKRIATECSAGGIDGVLFDLGISSYQLDVPTKGFSFQSDDPIDMRMDRNQDLSAREVVNEYNDQELSQILWNYGEERNSRKIARAIVSARLIRPIRSGKDLARVVEVVVGDWFLPKTLARVFQAVRIEVNDELESLKRGLSEAVDVLVPGGRMAVISYHSLEDRIVKETMKAASATSDVGLSKFLPPAALNPRLKILTKKVVVANDDEVRMNPRARSAKLRAAEKL